MEPLHNDAVYRLDYGSITHLYDLIFLCQYSPASNPDNKHTVYLPLLHIQATFIA